MIKRKNWTKKMLAVAACAGLLMTNPAFTEAATAAERSAYQAVLMQIITAVHIRM